MTRTFRLQEQLFHYSSIRIGDILHDFFPFEGKQNLEEMTISLNHTIKIPFIQDKPFYGIRLVPYFHQGDIRFSIPTIKIYGGADSETGEFTLDTDFCTIRTSYDPLHPGYKIKEFSATYEYIISFLQDIIIEVQVAQHLYENPLEEVHAAFQNQKHSFDIFKDGMSSHQDIMLNKSYFSLNLECIRLSSTFPTYNRTPFFQ